MLRRRLGSSTLRLCPVAKVLGLSGETNLEMIQSNVREAIADKFSLYCLGFGFVNFDFLKTMSLQNNGKARRIYEDSGADFQLKDFYKEVAIPLLTDVTMIYTGGSNLTQTHFSQYYSGSEIVVAGQITDNDIETFSPQVVAISGTRRVTVSLPKSPEAVSYGLERVWAHLTVKQLLEKELLLTETEKKKVKKKAVELSLKYSFVTPLTSMVVIKPPGESTDVLDKPKEVQAGPPWTVQPPHRGVAGMPGLAGPPWTVQPPHRGVAGMPGLAGRTSLSSVKPIPPSHRFLLKSEIQSLPLCFDITGNICLKLLQYPSPEVTVNGELDSVTNGGFSEIIIHFKAGQFLEVTTNEVNLQDRQTRRSITEEDPVSFGSLSVIRRNKEVDVAVGDIRIIILMREKDGAKFLWPVLRQKPSDNTNARGIFGLNPAVYEEVQRTPSTKLRIKGQEIYVTRSRADDHSTPHLTTPECWLMSAEAALQRPLDDVKC